MISSKLVRTYMKLTTKSCVFILSYLAIGISLCLFLTISIKLDVRKTYTATVKIEGKNIFLQLDNTTTKDASEVYFYTDKNSATYQASCKLASKDNKTLILALDSKTENIKAFIIQNVGKKIKVELPLKQTTLFNRIFFEGGKANE